MGMGNEMHKTPQMAQAGFKSNKNGTLVTFSHNSNKFVSKFSRMKLILALTTLGVTLNLQRVPTLPGFWDLKKTCYAKFALVGL